MDNVYDIKKKNNLNYILPKKFQLTETEVHTHQIVILIHIYYIEKISDYIRYIKNIPEIVDIIFTVSNNRIEKVLQEQLIDSKHKYKVIYKENRGRDISALLVAAKMELVKYQYIGFIHDKKEKNKQIKEDIDVWNECLWENMLGSKSYINNIIATLEEECDLGLLVPPVPVTRHLDYGYKNKWESNFENAKKIAKMLSIRCELNKDKPPITLGTVFWAKKSAIEKLLCFKWEYESFDPEPLENDGTLSHAIERILPYVAQDAGFYTGWVMTDEYASKQIEVQLHVITDVYNFLRKTSKICYIYQVEEWNKYEESLMYFCKKYCKLYIYGTGNNGKECFKYLHKNGINTNGFIVTSRFYKSSEEFMGCKIQILEEFVSDISMEHVGIILAVSEKDQKEILRQMKYVGIDEKKIYLWRTLWT